MEGRIHSIQSLGTLDGPGVRFVAFLQGCNLRCGCCHNPDTWECGGGTAVSATELVDKAERYKEYFGELGGITLSGGEPLLQADFACEVFSECHYRGINTCLDTSGSILNAKVEALLDVTDRVLLDIKYTTDEHYRSYVGCSLSSVLRFLELLQKKNIPTTVRQVIIPTLNDNEDNIRELGKIASSHSCVDKIELLPFRKMCSVKYEKLGIPFAFEHLPQPMPEKMRELEDLLINKRS